MGGEWNKGGREGEKEREEKRGQVMTPVSHRDCRQFFVGYIKNKCVINDNFNVLHYLKINSSYA